MSLSQTLHRSCTDLATRADSLQVVAAKLPYSCLRCRLAYSCPPYPVGCHVVHKGIFRAHTVHFICAGRGLLSLERDPRTLRRRLHLLPSKLAHLLLSKLAHLLPSKLADLLLSNLAHLLLYKLAGGCTSTPPATYTRTPPAIKTSRQLN